MKDRARELRREMTRQERHLWYDLLRDYTRHRNAIVSAASIGLSRIFIAAKRIL